MKKLLRVSWQQKNNMSKNDSIWISIMKILLLLSFVAGIFVANLMGREEVSNAGVLNDYFVEKFQYTQINGENLFFYIIGERMPLLFLLFLLIFTSLGIFSGILVVGWQGFSIGFMLSTGIAKYGIKGIILVLGGLFPQYLLYFPVYIFYCYVAVFLRQRFFAIGRENISERRFAYGIGLLIAIILMIVFVAGIFLESYVSPVILKRILKLF